MEIEAFLSEFHPEFIQIRRRLHRLAELSTEEYQTGRFLMNLLDNWEIPYHYPVADTGLVAVIEGKQTGTGKTVALRADMDALPITENTHVPYASQTSGVMHACGHDGHMAIALGAARYFKLAEDSFSGCIKIFFQPAEETIGGAERMIKEGCMEQPPVDYVIGLHLAPYLETGEIEVKYGNMYAASDEVTIVLQGKGCHGAYPDQGIDAIVMASALIGSLQSIVSRNVSPLEQCVFTIGTISGGTAHNILADTVTMRGALRTTSPAIRKLAKESIKRQVQGTASAFGGEGLVLFTPGYQALINHPFVTDTLLELSSRILGKEKVHLKETPGMGVEDFSSFLEKAPGVFYHLGCGNQKNGWTAPLHSKDFFMDEACLDIGIRLQTALAETLLRV